MRKLLLTVWCLLPIGGVAYHFGPGQEQLVLERVAAAQDAARAAVRMAQDATGGEASEQWGRAVVFYDEALEALPAERATERARLTLERAKCKLLCSQLPAANAELAALVDELEQRAGVEPELLFDARRTWANSEYYMTWLARLEGVAREEWEPRIEEARQTYKLLAQDESRSEQERVSLQEDLESAVRLARMDLGELQGLPLPSQ